MGQHAEWRVCSLITENTLFRPTFSSELIFDRYKAAGKHSGVIEGGRDGFENFLVRVRTRTRWKESCDQFY